MNAAACALVLATVPPAAVHVVPTHMQCAYAPECAGTTAGTAACGGQLLTTYSLPPASGVFNYQYYIIVFISHIDLAGWVGIAFSLGYR